MATATVRPDAVEIAPITLADGRAVLALRAPYHPSVPPLARSAGGRWSPALTAWLFDPRDLGRVRDLARAVYGTDGATPFETVEVLLDLTDANLDAREYYGLGRLLLERPSRDQHVRLGRGVILEGGELPPGGGSVKYPRILDRGDGPITLRVRDVPRSLAERLIKAWGPETVRLVEPEPPDGPSPSPTFDPRPWAEYLAALAPDDLDEILVRIGHRCSEECISNGS